MAKKKNKKETEKKSVWIEIITTLIYIVGFSGLVVIAVMAALRTWSSAEQKKEMIDMYILLKDPGRATYAQLIILVFFIATFLIQNNYFRKTIKLKNQRIDEIALEKTKLQELLTNRELNSSSKK